MALTKGNQFEWALLYYAKENISEEDRTLGDIQIMKPVQEKMKLVTDRTVQIKAEEVINNISAKIKPNDRVKAWRSFKKVSGGTLEPKADIYFKIGSKEYNCSVKYGPSYQLSSGGVRSSVELLKAVNFKLKSTKSITTDNALKIIEIYSKLDELADIGTQPQNKIKEKLNPERIRTKEEKFEFMSLQERLQQVLGSGRKKEPAEEFIDFKAALVREALTGEYTFKRNPNKIATYLLTEDDDFPKLINDTIVDSITKTASARISMKGRGSKIQDGKKIRYNEISVRIDAKKPKK